MIQVITGKKGSGKTKILLGMIDDAVKASTGDIICIEKCMKLTYSVNHKVRLVDAERYTIEGFDMLYGFVAGVLAGNYDIKEVFIDGILKIGGRNYDALGALLEKLAILAGDDVHMVITISEDKEALPESVLKYLIPQAD
ncbi:MAG: hypothetical protein MJ071_05000 [Oscillospiraceae bacterium]|nr:hypothetical protein [Oscillospiraceae bacterium]